jgi:hypothetical protein
MMAIFRYDQKPAPSFVEAIRLVDTVARFDTRNVVLLRARGDRRHEEQTKQKESDHYVLAYSPGGMDHLGLRMHCKKAKQEVCRRRCAD